MNRSTSIQKRELTPGRQPMLTMGSLEGYIAEEHRRLLSISQETCADATIGKWIDELGYEGLLEALSDDEILVVVYPDLNREFVEEGIDVEYVQDHWSRCRRCQLVAANHEWADDLLDGLFEDSKEPSVVVAFRKAAASA